MEFLFGFCVCWQSQNFSESIYSTHGSPSNPLTVHQRISKISRNRCLAGSRNAGSWMTIAMRNIWTTFFRQTMRRRQICQSYSNVHTNGSNCNSFSEIKSRWRDIVYNTYEIFGNFPFFFSFFFFFFFLSRLCLLFNPLQGQALHMRYLETDAIFHNGVNYCPIPCLQIYSLVIIECHFWVSKMIGPKFCILLGYLAIISRGAVWGKLCSTYISSDSSFFSLCVSVLLY
jgi:hypothetical protein